MRRTKGFLQRHPGAIQTDGSVQANDHGTPQSVVRIPLWVSIVVILGAVLTATGALISKVDPTLLTNGGPMTGAERVYADLKERQQRMDLYGGERRADVHGPQCNGMGTCVAVPRHGNGQDGIHPHVGR